MKRTILLLIILCSVSVFFTFSQVMRVSQIKLLTRGADYLCLDEGESSDALYEIQYYNTDPRATYEGSLELKITGPGYFKADNKKELTVGVKSESSTPKYLQVAIKCIGVPNTQTLDFQAKGDHDGAFLGGPYIKVFAKSKYEDLELNGLEKLVNGQTSTYSIERKCSVIDTDKTRWYIDSTSSGDAQIISTTGTSANVKALGGSVTLCADIYNLNNRLVRTLRKRVEAPYKFTLEPSVKGLCNVGDVVTYTLSNGHQIKKTDWIIKDNSNWSLISSDNHSAKVKALKNLERVAIDIQANITTKENTKVNVQNNVVWIGGPLITIKPIGNPNFQAGKSYEFEALLQGDDGATSIKWNILGDASVRPRLFLGDRSTAMVDLFQNRNGGSFRVYVDLTSSSGCKVQSGAYAGSFVGTGGALIDPPTGIEDPNQGIGKPYSSFSRNETSLLLTPQYKEIEILSFPNGILIKKIKNVSSFDINNYDLTSGIYLIRYKDQDNNVTTEKVKL